MDPAQSHQPQARAIALLRVRPLLQDAGDHTPCGRAALCRPRDETGRGPFGVRPMGPRHVGELRRKVAAAGEADVRGHPASFEKHLNGHPREAGLDALVRERIRHAVEVVIDVDVIIDVHAAGFPLRQLVPRAG